MITTFTFLGIEDDRAILSDDQGNKIYWPKDKIPADINSGAVLTFSIFAQKDLVKNNRELAGEILNEILKVSD